MDNQPPSSAAEDYLKAVLTLATNGNPKAQHNLGAMYLNGQGVTQDFKQAAHWFRLSATQGLALSQHNLGTLYLKGEGVSKNLPEAVKWFHLAADQGDPRAQHTLGAIYFEGLGVEKDLVQAYLWLTLAMDGVPDAIQHHARSTRDYVATQLHADQLERAQALVLSRQDP